MYVKIVVSFREGYRLRMFGNRVLRKIVGHKRDEVAGGWRSCMIRSFIVYICYHVFVG